MNELSKKWLYTFIAIAIAAIAVFVWACIKKDTTIMIATGLVIGIQILNIVQWIQRHFPKR